MALGYPKASDARAGSPLSKKSLREIALTGCCNGCGGWLCRGDGSCKSKLISPGQQKLPFAFDVRLSQIPEEWHQIAVRFRRANGIRDGDRERSIW